MPVDRNSDEAIRSIERRLRRKLNTKEQLVALSMYKAGQAAEAREICRRIARLANP